MFSVQLWNAHLITIFLQSSGLVGVRSDCGVRVTICRNNITHFCQIVYVYALLIKRGVKGGHCLI